MNLASGTPTNYFYTQDHLGSTREMTKTVSGTTTIEAQYGYDPYGIATKLQGSQEADFQYAGYYMHARSGLNMPVFRAYSSSFGRFINRDPIGEDGGLNLYAYVALNPIGYTDPLGLQQLEFGMHPSSMLPINSVDRVQMLFVKSEGTLSIWKDGVLLKTTPALSGGHLGDPLPNGVYDITSNPSKNGTDKFFGLEKHDIFGPSDYTFSNFWMHGFYRLHDGTVTAGCINVDKEKNKEEWKLIDSTLRNAPDRHYQRVINKWYDPTSKATVVHYGTMRVQD